MNKRHIVGVVAAAALITTAGGVGATAADLISGKDIQDDSIAGRDIRDGSIKSKDLADGTLTKLEGEKGDTGATGAKG